MVRENGISATRPIFPTYLLSSFRLAFPRRHSASSSSSGGSPTTSAETTPNNSPPEYESTINKASHNSMAPRRLSRTAEDTLRCSTCSSDLSLASQIISKGFTGRYGRAYLVSPPPLPAEQSLLNIRVGRSENRQLVTGWHVVADISCGICSRKLGWKYVDAKEESQKYKVGKFILETERVVTFRSWNDIPDNGEVLLDDCEANRNGNLTELDEDEIVFDSEDEDECEDIFAGVWNAETVAKRRRRMVARPKSVAESSMA